MPGNDANTYKCTKVSDSGLSAFAFDIDISGYGGESADQASFSGTFEQGGEKFSWTGDYVSVMPVDIQSTKIELARPAEAEGSTEELRTLTPFATKTTGLYKQGQDMAQVSGDTLIFQAS